MTKEAMISPEEIVTYQTGWDESKTPPEAIYTTGWRVAQVEPEGQTFPMAEPIFWTPCADDVEQDTWFYIPETKQIIAVPPQPLPPPNGIQPISEGTQTL